MYIPKLSGEYIGAEKKTIKYEDKKSGESKSFSFIEGQILQSVPTETGEKLEVVYIRFPESFDPESISLKSEISISGVTAYDTYQKRDYLIIESIEDIREI